MKIGILLVSVLLVLLIACQPASVSPQQGDDASSRRTGTAEQPSTTVPGRDDGFVGSIADAIKLNRPMHCTMAESQTNAKMEYYIKGTNTRAVITGPDGRLTYVLSTGTCSYTWTDENEGMEICVPPEEARQAQESPEAFNMPNTEGVSMKCVPEAIPDSMFVKPTGVNFVNLADLTKSFGMTQQ